MQLHFHWDSWAQYCYRIRGRLFLLHLFPRSGKSENGALSFVVSWILDFGTSENWPKHFQFDPHLNWSGLRAPYFTFISSGRFRNNHLETWCFPVCTAISDRRMILVRAGYLHLAQWKTKFKLWQFQASRNHSQNQCTIRHSVRTEEICVFNRYHTWWKISWMKHCSQVNAYTDGVNWHEEFVGLILEINCHQWLIMNRDLTIGQNYQCVPGLEAGIGN